MAAGADRIVRIDTSHAPMLVDPEGLAAVIEAAAVEVADREHREPLLEGTRRHGGTL